MRENTQPMKTGSTIFLQAVIVLIGIGAVALLLLEPQFEGRNTHATQFEVYFKDPFLAYVYVASTPFFVALYQVVKLLGLARHDLVFSPAAVHALRTTKYCAIAIIVFIAGAEVFILRHESDDAAGGVFMGLLFTFGAIVVATAAAVFERLLERAVAMKAEHDLTV